MEFSDLIKTPKVDVVVMNTQQGKPVEVSLHVSSHHLILSARKEGVEELWVRTIPLIKSYVNSINFVPRFCTKILTLSRKSPMVFLAVQFLSSARISGLSNLI
jgi:hypothetical protein